MCRRFMSSVDDLLALSTLTLSDTLHSNSWKHCKAFTSLSQKDTQLKYYKRHDSSPEVLQLVELESKPFGSASEAILKEIFHMDPRTSSQHDGIRLNKKIEIKAARYWVTKTGKADCKWQHLEPTHDYDYALLALLDFQEWKVWGIPKAKLMGELREKNIVTEQGKQGYWMCMSAALPYLTPIYSKEELDSALLTIH